VTRSDSRGGSGWGRGLAFKHRRWGSKVRTPMWSGTDWRTAKWIAIAHRLMGTQGHARAQKAQAGATDALADRLRELHGMQEARGSSPDQSSLVTLSAGYGWAGSSLREPETLIVVPGSRSGLLLVGDVHGAPLLRSDRSSRSGGL
jgi:hypothetical protein